MLGQADALGAIAPGRTADLVLLRADSAFLRPAGDIFNALVYAETGGSVDTVLVGGRVVLREGQASAVDETRLRARAHEAAERVTRSNAPARAFVERLEPYVRGACQACAAEEYPVNRYAAPV